MTPPVTHFVDSDGVGWIVFDDPGSRVNVFNPVTMAALRAAVEGLGEAAPKALVVTSGKERIFIAGADLNWLSRLADSAAAEQASRDGQALFSLFSDFMVPVVCAIHGACAGGGYELALACHWRMASDAKETVVGLPEVGIGVIPGWGGCTRLTRLIGSQAAAEHIMKASLVPASEAQRLGLVDEIVPAAELKARAKAAALRLAADGVPSRTPPPAPAPGFFAEQRRKAAGRMRGQPAPLAALDAIEQGAGAGIADALAIEAGMFGKVAAGEIAKNLIHVFQLKEAGRKRTVEAWFPPSQKSTPPEPCRMVGIVGAGVMGSGIAQACAARGVGVMMTDADVGALKQGVEVIRKLFHEAVERGKMTGAAAHKAMGSIGISTDIEDFADCDLVIEAIVENVEAKRGLFERVAKVVGPNCVLASNTSAIPIEEIMARATEAGRTVGLHFFNPVSRMPLVEVVLGPSTTRDTAERAVAFVKALGKTPVICKSSPGFLVTRVLFFYLNAACRLREQGVSADVIDGAMREWGWPMGPMRLIDEVGVDVTDFIFGEMKHYFPSRFEASSLCQRMLAAGMRGRKNGASSGFYTYGPTGEALNPETARLIAAAPKTMDPLAVQNSLNGVLIEETRRTIDEGVLKSPDDADLALLIGAGFPPHRGGLLRGAGHSPPNNQ